MSEDTKTAALSHLEDVETIGVEGGVPAVDTMLSELVAQDQVPWYRKRNLRKLYLLFIGSVLCIETTSGYDASVVNGLQAVPKWNECKLMVLCSLYLSDHVQISIDLLEQFSVS